MLVLAPSSQTKTLVHCKSTSPTEMSWTFQGISDVVEGLKSNWTKVLNYRREVICLIGEVRHLKDRKGREWRTMNKWMTVFRSLCRYFLICAYLADVLNMSCVTKLMQWPMKILFLELTKVWEAESSAKAESTSDQWNNSRFL